MATLGISTNTRLLGMAIISDEGLAKYSIRLFKSSWSAAKANLIVTSLEPCVRQYCITQVVLSMPPSHQQTKEYRYLVSCLQKFFERNNIPLNIQTPRALYELCDDGVKRTKKSVMQALTGRFPELNLYYQKEVQNKNKYYVKLFEAVGVALLHELQG